MKAYTSDLISELSYSLDQTPQLLFISSPKFVRRLLIHSCQVYKRRDRDRVENRINAHEARAKITDHAHFLGNHTHFRAIMYYHAH